jgi:hypothetical protein
VEVELVDGIGTSGFSRDENGVYRLVKIKNWLNGVEFDVGEAEIGNTVAEMSPPLW